MDSALVELLFVFGLALALGTMAAVVGAACLASGSGRTCASGMKVAVSDSCFVLQTSADERLAC